jgi:hypothetical protein
LNAFRANMPFDRFTREQLAGDLVPDATVEQRTASAYNRMNRASAEGGIQPEEYLAKYGADRVRTTATVWLGATMGCAECHDHKFDPFLAKDFYAMKAFFADIKETGLVPDRGERAWGSKLFLPTPEQKQQKEALEEELEASREELRERAEDLRTRRVDWESDLLAAHKAGKLAWQYQQPLSATAANGTKLKVYKDEPLETAFYLFGSLNTETKKAPGVIVASGPNPDNDTFTIQLKPGAGTWTAVGVEAWQEETLPGNRLGRGYKGFILSEVEAEMSVPGQQPRKLQFELATSGGFGEEQGYRAMHAIDGDAATGWGVHFGEARNPFLALRLNAPLTTTADAVITVKLCHNAPVRRAVMGRFRLALSASPLHSFPEGGDSGSKFRLKEKPENVALLALPVDLGIPAEVMEALNTPEADRSEAEQELVLRHFEWAAPELQDLHRKVERLAAKLDLLNAQIPRVIATERMRPRVTRVLARGNFLDTSGEIVEPAVPEMFGKLDTGERRATRLDLANWLVSKDNPLTARTFANRTWRLFFGTGLSKVLEDLGSQGEWPTHPELLDWLAAEFMTPSINTAGGSTHNWDMKHLVRTIVTSHTYRQDSATNKKIESVDPDNRLLARQSRFRVDAEAVHDTLLAVSGLLVDKFGGPSVRPKQPAGYLAAMNFPKRDYSEGRGDDLYRRALYTEWQRTFLHPSLLTFDAPTREECTVNRVNSNTPLQALVVLNDPLYVEAARVFAQNILQSGQPKLDGQLDWAFARALNRKPEKSERKILSTLYQNNLQRFRQAPESAREFLSIGEAPLTNGQDPAELAALTTVARAILNLHETITRN